MKKYMVELTAAQREEFVSRLSGHRFTLVTAQRTKQEWAQILRRLSDECYPEADKIVLVMDNLNTHTLASLYEVFPVAEARLCQRFFGSRSLSHLSTTHCNCNTEAVLADFRGAARAIPPGTPR